MCMRKKDNKHKLMSVRKKILKKYIKYTYRNSSQTASLPLSFNRSHKKKKKKIKVKEKKRKQITRKLLYSYHSDEKNNNDRADI